MGSFEELIDTAVRDRDIPGIMLHAQDKSGKPTSRNIGANLTQTIANKPE